MTTRQTQELVAEQRRARETAAECWRLGRLRRGCRVA
jgi:hypothetical protein